MQRLLFVTKDAASASYLASLLGAELDIRHMTRWSDALTEIAVWEPDAILIEFPLVDIDALSFCRHLRHIYDIPIVIWSANSRESDIVQALEAGADDYLVMPIRPVELVARLRAILRRAKDAEQGRLRKGRLLAGEFEIRLDEYSAYRKGVPIELTPLEFRLLACLVRESGRVVSHSKLIAQVWGPEYASCHHYLRLYIRYLRAKIEDDARNPKLILSEWGVGYRFQPSSANT